MITKDDIRVVVTSPTVTSGDEPDILEDYTTFHGSVFVVSSAFRETKHLGDDVAERASEEVKRDILNHIYGEYYEIVETARHLVKSWEDEYVQPHGLPRLKEALEKLE